MAHRRTPLGGLPRKLTFLLLIIRIPPHSKPMLRPLILHKLRIQLTLQSLPEHFRLIRPDVHILGRMRDTVRHADGGDVPRDDEEGGMSGEACVEESFAVGGGGVVGAVAAGAEERYVFAAPAWVVLGVFALTRVGVLRESWSMLRGTGRRLTKARRPNRQRRLSSQRTKEVKDTWFSDRLAIEEQEGDEGEDGTEAAGAEL